MVEKLKAERNVEVSWRPFFLRPDTPPEGMDLPANLRARALMAMERLHQMARANGMEMISPDRIPNTRIAHEATEYARDTEKTRNFTGSSFTNTMAKGRTLDAGIVLRAAAEEAGLNAVDLEHQVTAGRYTVTVAEQIEEAYALGITACQRMS